MKKFISYIILFAFFFLLIFKFSYSFYISEIKFKNVFSNYDLSIKKDSNIEVILFGSSVENHFDASSKSHYRISEIIDTLSNYKVVSISNPGFHMSVFNSFIQNIMKLNKNEKLRYVILPINMRNFSASWYMSRYNQFKDVDFALNINTYIKKDYINSADRNNTVFNCNDSVFFNDYISSFYISSLDNELEKCVNYGQLIKEKNYNLEKLKEILTWNSVQKDFEIVFYFTPIDVNTFDKKTRKNFKENLSFLKKLLIKNNLRFIDLTNLDSSYFDYDKTVNEHVIQSGKFFIAKNIKDSLLIL